MFPLRDVIPTRTTPWVNIAIIVVNVIVYAHEFVLPRAGLMRFIFDYGLVPAHFTWPAVFTSMFVHENLIHVGGNMWSLWIFGDNVEERMGHGRYLVFYLLAGTVAALAQTMAAPASRLPLIGASGAIAGVMGAYFVMFPRSRILVLIPIFFFANILEVPAVFFLGFWFLLQIVGGFGQPVQNGDVGGVAFMAHLGGFLTGLLTVWFFKRPERERVDWWSA